MANVEEEEAWINEKLNLVGSEDYGDTLAAVQVRSPVEDPVSACGTNNWNVNKMERVRQGAC